MGELVTVAEACERLGITHTAIYRKVSAGVVDRVLVNGSDCMHIDIDQLKESMGASLLRRCSEARGEVQEERPKRAEWLTVAEAAERLLVTRMAIYIRVQNGTMDASEIDGVRVVNVADVRTKPKGKVPCSLVATPKSTLRPADACKVLNCKYETLRKYIKDGKVKTHKYKGVDYPTFSSVESLRKAMKEKANSNTDLSDDSFAGDPWVCLTEILAGCSKDDGEKLIQEIVKNRNTIYYSNTGKAYLLTETKGEAHGDAGEEIKQPEQQASAT